MGTTTAIPQELADYFVYLPGSFTINNTVVPTLNALKAKYEILNLRVVQADAFKLGIAVKTVCELHKSILVLDNWERLHPEPRAWLIKTMMDNLDDPDLRIIIGFSRDHDVLRAKGYIE